jgi:hypothetical protein
MLHANHIWMSMKNFKISFSSGFSGIKVKCLTEQSSQTKILFNDLFIKCPVKKAYIIKENIQICVPKAENCSR